MTQEQAFRLLTMGYNVFLTGGPGTGKTYVANAYANYLKKHGVNFAVTASTGIAASHLGGTTIHSFSGIGVREYLSDFALDGMLQKEYLQKRFKDLQVLFIDEISMLSAGYLEMVDQVLQTFKRNSKPFGGVQVVLIGDFFQLPPVSRDNNANFAFTSRAWASGSIFTCYLQKTMRHADNDLVQILHEIRSGEVSENSRMILDDTCQKELPEGDITLLFTHNADVDYVNGQKLQEIPDKMYSYKMVTKGKKNHVEGLQKSCLAPGELQLKDGALVMFVKNNPVLGYVNGTIGVVTDCNDGGYPTVETLEGQEIKVEPESWRREVDGKVTAELSQIPLRLAWAITVHKSQGMTLDAAAIDLTKTFALGQGYVALSRVRSLSGLYLNGYNEYALQVDEHVRAQDQLFLQQSEKNVSRLQVTSDERLDEIAELFVPTQKNVARDFESCAEWEAVEEKSTIKTKQKVSTYEKTFELLTERKSIAEIAEARGLTSGTIVTHIETLLKSNRITSEAIDYLYDELVGNISNDEFEVIAQQFASTEDQKLGVVFTFFDGRYTYEQLRAVRMLVG